VTDDEVEEAIQGTSMLLHHVVPSKNNKTDQATGGATGATGNANATGGASGATGNSNTTVLAQKKNCTLSPMDKLEECKIFSIYGRKCNKDMSYSEAQAVCEEKGAHVCSQAEMVEAFKSGYESAACGWTSTETSMGHLVEMVLKEDKPEIEGKKGFNVCALEKNLENTYGVHCCGV